MAAVGAIMDALAARIEAVLGPLIDGLQVEPRLVWNPTPPCIDVYPGSPFQEQIGMGRGNNELFFTIRARVATPDHEGAQDLLLSMMDPEAATSVIQVFAGTATTLGGTVDYVAVEPPTEYGSFGVPSAGELLGCTWRARVLP